MSITIGTRLCVVQQWGGIPNSLRWLSAGDRLGQGCGYVVLSLSGDLAARTPLLEATPMLEKERHASVLTASSDLEYAGALHRRSALAGFAGDDDPVNLVDVQVGQPSNERFAVE